MLAVVSQFRLRHFADYQYRLTVDREESTVNLEK